MHVVIGCGKAQSERLPHVKSFQSERLPHVKSINLEV